MKLIKIVLIALAMINSNVFAEWVYDDKNGLKHTIEHVQETKYKDINAGKNLSLRPSSSKKIYGDIETIGATILIPKENQPGGGGFYYNPDSTSRDGSTVVKDFRYVVEDGGENSAKATFNFTNKYVSDHISADKIIFARLYWAGGFSKPWKYDDINHMLYYYLEEIKDFNTVTFKTPDGKTHHLKAEGDENIKWYGSYSEKGMQFMYQASVDVTELVKNSISKGRTFSAGNIKTTKERPYSIGGFRDDGWSYGLYAPHYGGWALSIIYDFGAIEGTKAKLKPRGVYVYDGLAILAPIHLKRGQENRTDTLSIDINGFFTPASGKVNSNLTVLSFGAKKEVGAEDIQIKKSSDKKFYSVFSKENEKGHQFNSTITRFGEHMNSQKIYHNQMDLDIFDLADHMSNKQTSTEIKLTAQVIRGAHYTYGERANIGLVAFSTELYQPEVCYIEKLQVRDRTKNTEDAFKDVSTDKDAQTVAKEGDTLRVQLIVKNRGNEDADKVALSALIDKKSALYTENSTHVKPNVSRNSNFKVLPSDKINDNTGLQKYKDNVITVSVGEKDKEGDIGTLNSTNQAFIQFETTLGDEFNKDEYITYNAKFINKSINLEFDGKINRCEDKRYYLEVAGISNRVVNKHFQKLGNSENLFTQLASRAFDTKLLNISTSSSKGRILEKFDLLPTEKVKVDVISGGNCEKGQNVIDEIAGNTDNFFLFSKEQLDNKEILDLKGIKIKKAYPALYFRISYLDSNSQLIKKPSCSSDPFSIRPKELKFYNASNGTASFDNLVGGQGYRNIWLQAVDNDNKIAQNYSTKVNPINFALSSQRPATCPDPNFAFQNETTLEADFDNGRGELKRVIDGVNNLFAPESGTNFVYPEVGHVLITARDKKWTTIDQAAGATETQSHLHDCIINSDTITENSDGKIGCDISSRNDLNLLFKPNDIVINNLQILNFNNGDMTYLSGNVTGMEASVIFNITARLADNSRTTAKLYTRGCYAKDVAFTTAITGDVPDFTNLNGTAIDDPIARNRAVLQNILYFNQATQDPDDNKKTINTKANATSDNDGAHTLDRRSFLSGIASYSIRFNFGRDIRFARNPFRITSNNFTFNNISDTDTVPGAPYVAPILVTAADFYYGRVYAPSYEGPLTGFNAQVYYAVFCNGCNTATYTIANSATPPQTNNWFTNRTHTALHGQVTQYISAIFNDGSTVITPQGNIANGIETVRLSSTFAPKDDIIQMNVPGWLLYNQVDPTATTNDFNVKFFNVATGWGGQSLDKGGKDVGVGQVISGEKFDSGKGISERTNKRLDW